MIGLKCGFSISNVKKRNVATTKRKSKMNTYGSEWPVGSVIEMFDEQLRIRENLGSSGVVETLDGEFVSSRYYWQFGADRAVLISTPN